jgi:hypothetical protein
MPITIKGIRLETVNLSRDDKTNVISLSTASYSLMSSADRVLANQTIGGYGETVKVAASPATLSLLTQFTESYQKDVSAALGLE